MMRASKTICYRDLGDRVQYTDRSPPLDQPTVTAWEAWRMYAIEKKNEAERSGKKGLWWAQRIRTAEQIIAAIQRGPRLVVREWLPGGPRLLHPADYVDMPCRGLSWITEKHARREFFPGKLDQLVFDCSSDDPLIRFVTTPADWAPVMGLPKFTAFAWRYYSKIRALRGTLAKPVSYPYQK